MSREAGILIGRVRMHAAGVEPLLAQQRTAHLLNSADLRPTALPPGAILVVRRLRDPLPQTLNVQMAQALPTLAWEQATRAALDELLRRAVGPAAATASAGDAVLFADQAELLACLAHDWLAGLLPERWWWRHVLRRADLRRDVLATWANSPTCIPAALSHLHCRGEAVRFVAALSDGEASHFLAEVVAQFGLDHLAAALSAVPPTEPTRVDISPSESSTEPAPALVVPWFVTPDPALQALTPTGRALLGVSITLVRQPQLARSKPFARAVVQQLTSPAIAQQNALPALAGAAPALPPATPELQPADSTPPPTLQPSLAEKGLVLQETASDTPAPQPKPPAKRLLSQPEPSLSVPTSPSPAPLSESLGEPITAAWDDLTALEIETEFGGVFYVLNLGLSLGLYADFTTPATPGIDLPIWDFLALLGAALLGERLHADPAWALLAQLSGRAAREPFADPTAADLRALLLLRRPGFGKPILRRSPPSRQVRFRFRRKWDATRWCNHLIALARLRLLQALGLTPDADVGLVLLHHRARVRLTAVRLDIFLSLDSLPIAIRLAGLDRDPGWIPAAGRDVAFHFV